MKGRPKPFEDVQFPNVQRFTKRLKNGGSQEYCYHRLLKRRLKSPWGSPEFAAEYAEIDRQARSFRGRPQSVYFIQGAQTRHIKIGKAAFPAKRLMELQVGCPDDLVLIGTLPDPTNGGLERILHRQFAAGHLRGEWFRESPALVAFLAERGFDTVGNSLTITKAAA